MAHSLPFSPFESMDVADVSGEENDAVSLGPQFLLRRLKSDVLK